jgi:hypothetical protein
MEESTKGQESTKESTKEKEELHMLYISQMSVQERKAYEIAKEHLETSFNIDKSIGFIDWKKKKER